MKKKGVVGGHGWGSSSCSSSMLHHVRASHGWSLETLETCWTCLFSLSCRCASVRFVPTLRRRVRDHVKNACLRDILMKSGGRHLVDTCTRLIVAHRHARTSRHSAERLNLCPSGEELSSMSHLSLFRVPCACSLADFKIERQNRIGWAVPMSHFCHLIFSWYSIQLEPWC